MLRVAVIVVVIVAATAACETCATFPSMKGDTINKKEKEEISHAFKYLSIGEDKFANVIYTDLFSWCSVSVLDLLPLLSTFNNRLTPL